MAERVLSVRLRAIVDGYERAMGRAATATEKVAATGKKMEDAGKKMSIGFSLPMVAAGGFALRSAVQFESAFAGVQKTVNGTAAEMAALEQGIIDMANSTPSTREEIAGIAEAAGQLGVSTPNILGFTKTIVDLGNSTNLVGEEGAMMLAQFANITQMPQAEFGRLGSTITALGNAGAATERDIGEMALRLAGAGNQVKLTEAQIVSLASGLADLGIPAELGGSAVSRVLLRMQKAVIGGGKELEAFADVAGVTGEEFAAAFRGDASQALLMLINGLQRVSEQGGSTAAALSDMGLAEERTVDVMNRLTGAGDRLAGSLRIGESAWEENSALAREAGMRYATTESQLRIAANRATDVARQFGEVLVPAVLAALNVVEPLAGGLGGLVQVFAGLPSPVQAFAGSIMAVAVASGPTIWALGKLSSLYGPVVSGAIAAAGNLRYLAQSIQSVAATRGVSSLTAGIGVLRSSLLGLMGPQMAVVAGIAAIAAGAFLAARASKQVSRDYMSTAEAADILSTSVGLLTRELRDNKKAAEEIEVLSDDDFRAANEAIIQMIRHIEDLDDQQGLLLSIGFEMQASGNSPEKVVEHVTRLAQAAGVEVPAELTVSNVGDFEHQVEMAKQAAERAMADWDPASDVDMTRTMREELTRLSESAALLWQNDETAAWAQMLGVATGATRDSADATNYLVDEMLRLTGVSGLNTSSSKDLASALDDITASGSAASAEQKEMLSTIRSAAEEMDGGLTPANFALAASHYTAGLSAAGLSAKINGQREAADGAADSTSGLSEEQDGAGDSAEKFAASLEAVAANAAFARMDFDAGAAAAQAFGEALDRSSRMGGRMSAGLQGGAALKALSEGLTGQKRIADIQKQATKETDKSAKSIDRLADAARRADPRIAGLEIQLQAAAAAGEAFSESIDNSSMLDDQVSSALSLGDAYRSFEKTFRRLPKTLDITGIAMGKLRPREAEAVQNMLSLGKAAKDYLATLIEMGESDGRVAGEAARMRDEYTRLFREMGLGEEQIRQYLQAMGLLPEQVTTAIRVAGLEAASTRLQAYLQLLDGKIPAEIATSVIAQIESGDVEGAAARLAEFARSNPALLEVDVDSSSVDETAKKIADVRDQLWELPKDFDPLKAMLGGYTDAQQAALDAVMQFGDGMQQYLSTVAHDGNAEEIRTQAERIRDAFLEQIGMGDQVGREYEDMSTSAKAYLDLIGLSDWQIDSAITLSGDTEAMFKIQMLKDMLTADGGAGIPDWLNQQVSLAIADGDIPAASNLLTTFVRDMQDGVLNDPLLAELEAQTEQATTELTDWQKLWGFGISVPVNVSMTPEAQALLKSVGGTASFGAGGYGTKHRAAGGSIWPGQLFMVGEQGPELGYFPQSGGMLSAPQTRKAVERLSGTSGHRDLSGYTSAAQSMNDSRIVDRLERMESALGNAGVSFGDLIINSPSEKQTPRRVAEAVGVRVRR